MPSESGRRFVVDHLLVEQIQLQEVFSQKRGDGIDAQRRVREEEEEGDEGEQEGEHLLEGQLLGEEEEWSSAETHWGFF